MALAWPRSNYLLIIISDNQFSPRGVNIGLGGNRITQDQDNDFVVVVVILRD
jgi:hypothetical protein